MRGEVLRFDEVAGEGIISGDDGHRYRFARRSISRGLIVEAGAIVDFEPSGGDALDVYVLNQGVRQRPMPSDSLNQPIVPPKPVMAASSPQILQSEAAPFSVPEVEEAAGRDIWPNFIYCLQKSFSLTGRARRSEYWGFIFIMAAILVLPLLVDALLIASLGSNWRLPWLSILINLATLPAATTLGIRRLHDIGLSGGFYILLLVPQLVSILVLFDAARTAGGDVFSNPAHYAGEPLLQTALFIASTAMLICSFIPTLRRTNDYGPDPKVMPT